MTISNKPAAAPRKQSDAAGGAGNVSDYVTGQNNKEFMGMDLHIPVFPISALLVLTFCLFTLSFPEAAGDVLNGARSWTLETLDWFFVIVTNISFLFCVYIGASSFGKIRLGGASATPEFSTLSWFSMLFAAGVGIGMMFYGTAEPLAYYTGWSGTPLGVDPLTDEAERLAFSATIFHWGFIPWAIYAVIGLALGFFAFNKGLPLTIRSTFYPIFGEKVWGWRGDLIDLAAVLATLFGLATSLGLGAKQALSGLSYLFGFEPSLTGEIMLIAAITGFAIFSVIRGLHGGVKVLSNLNICLALGLLLFVIVAGPTGLIFYSFFDNTFKYVADIPRLTNWIGREDTGWFHDWTIFYWAWWISWSPFVGMFIARVSKGRTIREFLSAVLIVPVFVEIVWFSSFGTIAIQQFQNGAAEVSNGISDVSLVLFQVLGNLPLAEVSCFVSIILLIVFFVTSSDSGSLVVDSLTSGGKLDAPIQQRVFWASMEGLVAAVLLIGGGTTALSTLQSGVITAGLPFAVVLLACCFSLHRGLRDELRQLA